MTNTEPPPSPQQVTAHFWDYYQVWSDDPNTRMLREQAAAWLHRGPQGRRRRPSLPWQMWQGVRIGVRSKPGDPASASAQWERAEQAAEATVAQAFARHGGLTEPAAREVVRQVVERLVLLDPQVMLDEKLHELVGPDRAGLRQAAQALLGWYAAGGGGGDAGLVAVQQAYAPLALDRHEPGGSLPDPADSDRFCLRLAGWVVGRAVRSRSLWSDPRRRAAYQAYVGAWRAWFAQQSASPSAD